MANVRRTLFILMISVAALVPDARAFPADTTEFLASLRAAIGSSVIRVRASGDVFVVNGAVLTPKGVGFEPDDIEGAARWRAGEKLVPSLPGSPIPWSAIDRIDARKSGIPKWALIGALALAAGTYVATYDPHEEWHKVTAVAALPAGAIIGGVVGAFRPDWRWVWKRAR